VLTRTTRPLRESLTSEVRQEATEAQPPAVSACRPLGAWDHLSASDMGSGPGGLRLWHGDDGGRFGVGQERRRGRLAGGGSSVLKPGF
jgi:hypothetical protein